MSAESSRFALSIEKVLCSTSCTAGIKFEVIFVQVKQRYGCCLVTIVSFGHMLKSKGKGVDESK